MYDIGLKLWSTNTGTYFDEARRLYDEGIFNYVELYVVPGTEETLDAWKKLEVPFLIHNAHFAHGFNLAKKEKRVSNCKIYEQSRRFADELKADGIIFHGGIDGEAEEAANQLAAFKEKRAILENKPFVALPNRMGGKYCRGATEEEIAFVLHGVGCRFCLDIGHAVCSANSQGSDPYTFIGRLMQLSPCMFHLSDVSDMSSPYDSHPHLGAGELILSRLTESVFPPDARISVETDKDDPDSLADFVRDVQCLKNLF